MGLYLANKVGGPLLLSIKICFTKRSFSGGAFAEGQGTSLNIALPATQFLVAKWVPVLNHLPYFPGITPCDLHMLYRAKSALKETNFQSTRNK